MRKMTCKGFEIKELANGKFRCSVRHWYDRSKKYTEICDTFRDAGEFVWNFADNHDVSHAVCEKMCSVFGRPFFED